MKDLVLFGFAVLAIVILALFVFPAQGQTLSEGVYVTKKSASGNDRIVLTQEPCVDAMSKYLAQLVRDQFVKNLDPDKMRASVYQMAAGQDIPGCWAVVNGRVIMTWADGDAFAGELDMFERGVKARPRVPGGRDA